MPSKRLQLFRTRAAAAVDTAAAMITASSSSSSSSMSSDDSSIKEGKQERGHLRSSRRRANQQPDEEMIHDHEYHDKLLHPEERGPNDVTDSADVVEEEQEVSTIPKDLNSNNSTDDVEDFSDDTTNSTTNSSDTELIIATTATTSTLTVPSSNKNETGDNELSSMSAGNDGGGSMTATVIDSEMNYYGVDAESLSSEAVVATSDGDTSVAPVITPAYTFAPTASLTSLSTIGDGDVSGELHVVIVSILLALLLAVGALLFAIRILSKRRRGIQHKKEIYEKLASFNVNDIDIVKANTGGWHGSYHPSMFDSDVRRVSSTSTTPKTKFYNHASNIYDADDAMDLAIETSSFRKHASALLNDTIWSDRGSYHLRSTKPFSDINEQDDDDSDSYSNNHKDDFYDDGVDDDDDSDDDGILSSAVTSLVSRRVNNRRRRGEYGGNSSNKSKEDFKQKLSVGI